MPNRNDKSVLAQFRAKLGKVPDQQIAEQAGVSRTLVVNYRKKLGIAAYQGHKTPPAAPAPVVESSPAKAFRGRRSALDEYMDVLGKLPDADIAKMAGVTAENVRTYRNRRGIAATWQPAPARTEVASAAPAPAPAAPVPAPAPPAPAAELAPKATRPRKAAAAPVPVEAPAPVATVVTPPIAPAAEPVAPPAAPAPAPAASAAPAPVAPAPAPAAPAASSAASNTVFLVVVDTDQGQRSYAILGADIADAAATASARVSASFAGATIRSIQRVAELLA